MALALLGGDAMLSYAPARTASPAGSEVTAMDVDSSELPALPSFKSAEPSATFSSVRSVSSVTSTLSTESKKSAVKRWFAKLAGRQ